MLFLSILLLLMGILLWIVDGGGPVLAVLSVVCLVYWMVKRERLSAERKQRSAERQRARSEIEGLAKELLTLVQSAFLIKSCSRCHESEALFVSVSPHARSVEYQCANCNKTMYAAACSADAPKAKRAQDRLLQVARKYPWDIKEVLNMRVDTEGRFQPDHRPGAGPRQSSPDSPAEITFTPPEQRQGSVIQITFNPTGKSP